MADAGDKSMYPGTADLLEFVSQRTKETLRDAQARGDELRARFATRSLAILADVRATLDEGAAIGELMAARYLRRMAHDYRDHPAYRAEWHLDDR